MKKEEYQIDETVLAFNNVEWSKTGDLPEGNDKYFQKARILRFRKSKRGEDIADVIYTNGKKSNGHFLHALRKI